MKSIPQWWSITFGIILIILGFGLFFLFKKSKQEVEKYKEEQLRLYKQKNPKFKGNYEQSKLILPWSQKMKLTMWPVLGISLLIVGFSLLGFSFNFFIR